MNGPWCVNNSSLSQAFSDREDIWKEAKLTFLEPKQFDEKGYFWEKDNMVFLWAALTSEIWIKSTAMETGAQTTVAFTCGERERGAKGFHLSAAVIYNAQSPVPFIIP